MKKLCLFALIVTLAAAVPALAQGSTNFSGTALSGLVYSGNPGDAQYVAGTPDLAQLLTPDSGTALTADSPAVFLAGPWGDLSAFTASYDLYSSSGPSGTSPYWILYLTDDPRFALPIVADGGPTLNASSLVHVGDLTSGSITLAALDLLTDPNSGSAYGLSTVAWAGVEIGNWDNGTNVIPASASFDSFTVHPVPEGGSGNLYLLLAGMACLAALVLGRRSGSASALAN